MLDSSILTEWPFAVEAILITATKAMINAISIKCDSIKFIDEGEPLLGSKRDSG